VASFWRITIATLLVVFVLYKIFDNVGVDRRIHDDEMSGIRLHYVDDAVCLYAGEHGGRLPDNLKDAVAGAGFEPKDTQCPPTRTHGAKLQNPPEFMYLGAGLPIKDMADEQIIACEPFNASAANKNETIVVLRADSTLNPSQSPKSKNGFAMRQSEPLNPQKSPHPARKSPLSHIFHPSMMNLCRGFS